MKPKFFAGQRVKIDCPKSMLHNMETRILIMDAIGHEMITKYGFLIGLRQYIGAECAVPPEGEALRNKAQGGYENPVFKYEDLIPIQDPNNEKIDWEQMRDLWMPEELQSLLDNART